MLNRTDQRNNQIRGSQAGRDVVEYNQTYITHYNGVVARATAIQRLNRLFDEECGAGTISKDVIEELLHYHKPPEGVRLIGLEAKLSLAGRAAEYRRAAAYKERFTMKLAKHQLYNSAQRMFVLFLSKVKMLFETYIELLLQRDSPEDELRTAIYQQVIVPALEYMEDNVLYLSDDEVKGALYFLTGNCHIKWHTGDAAIPPST